MIGTEDASATFLMYSQSASREYLCARVRPCNVSADAPHSLILGTNVCATLDVSLYPILVLNVNGTEQIKFELRTSSSMRFGFSSNIDPAPLLHIKSIGHPMLMSMKSHSMVSSNAWTHLPKESEWPPQIWTPNMSSDLCRRTNAHSLASPLSKLVAKAISPHVMSAPSVLHNRRNGKLPTVVNGARYNLFLKSIVFFSFGLSS